MDENYKPKRREVFGEIGRGIGKFALVTGLWLSVPYIIPTYIRQNIEINYGGKKEKTDKLMKNLSSTERRVHVLGALTGLTGDVMQTIGYGYLATHDHLEALLIPVTTNALSGGWEVGRKIYNNARQRLIDKVQTLEERDS